MRLMQTFGKFIKNKIKKIKKAEFQNKENSIINKKKKNKYQ